VHQEGQAQVRVHSKVRKEQIRHTHFSFAAGSREACTLSLFYHHTQKHLLTQERATALITYIMAMPLALKV
jgi:hypothetical protein